MSDNPKLISEAQAKERLYEIMLNGKLLALETGWITGALEPDYIRSEAADILQRHADHLSDETKKRLQALLFARDNQSLI